MATTASLDILSPAHAAGDAATPRRVLFVTHVGEAGGAEYQMLSLCRAVGSSAEVLLLQHGSLEATLRELQIRFSVCPMPPAARRVRKEGGLRSILSAVPGTLAMLRNIARHGKRFDAVVCFSQKSFVLAALARPLLRRPILWFMNDILSEAHFSRPLIRTLVTLSRYSANHIVVNSQASLRAWLDSGGTSRHVSVIYPGLYREMPSAPLKKSEQAASYKRLYGGEAPLIGMFGRVSRWKGQDVFLRAMAKLPKANAIIVGGALFAEQEYERQLKALARELGIEHRVRFIGHSNDVMTLMAACDVAVHCSSAPEPFGMVITEAMFVGTPVIASDAGGAREIITPDETGQLTPLKDHEALATAINRYLSQPHWSDHVARKAQARVFERFSGSATTSGFLRLLGSL